MIKASDLTEKEVVNINDGKRLGYITDVCVDLQLGKITAIIIPNDERLFGVFGKDYEYKIPWKGIKKIGMDVILVDLGGKISHDGFEDYRDKDSKSQFITKYDIE